MVLTLAQSGLLSAINSWYGSVLKCLSYIVVQRNQGYFIPLKVSLIVRHTYDTQKQTVHFSEQRDKCKQVQV